MADCKRKTELLSGNPLCGIDTYKDAFNLATGECTRYVKKLVLTGEETSWYTSNGFVYNETIQPDYLRSTATTLICSHYKAIGGVGGGAEVLNGQCALYRYASVQRLYIRDNNYTSVADFKTYLQQQYAAGTPVTVWYVLATAETETIPVPSGLTGTVEGYLNQDGTPTPTNPIYPTANPVDIWLHSLRKLGTDTDTITTLPAVLYPTGTTATVGLKGNMQQTGTPTPQNPVMPQGTGERTGNLFDASTATFGKYINAQGIETTSSAQSVTERLNHSDFFAVVPNESCTLSSVKSSSVQQTVAFCWYDATKTFLNRTTEQKAVGTTTYSITGIAPSNARFAIVNYTTANNKVMLNTGSTALPYEPYGYKIPISCGGTTNNAYLGEVQTTRQIKQLVLTGEENWENSINPTLFGVIRLLDLEPFIPKVTAYCSHYIYNPIQSGLTANMVNGEFALQKSSNAFNLYIRNTDYTTRLNFKDYLAAQYAAGTPVTIWYVLANEETGIVNEPLRKIGDYADEVSGISIPVTAGGDSFDVQTTLKPSEVSLTYTGWHDAQCKEYDGSQWV